MFRARSRMLGKLAVLAVMAALGVTLIAGMKTTVGTEPFMTEGEVVAISGPGLYPPYLVEEMASRAKLAVVGTLGSGRFVKKNAAGEEGKLGTQANPAFLYYLVDFTVTEYLKGSGPDKITLVLPAIWVDRSLDVMKGSELTQGSNYLVLLWNKKDNYDDRYFGIHHHRVHGLHGKWLLEGGTATSKGYGEELTIPAQELKDRVSSQSGQ